MPGRQRSARRSCSLVPSSRALCRQHYGRQSSTSAMSTMSLLHPAPRQCLHIGSLIPTKKQFLDSPLLRNPTSLQSMAGPPSWVPSYLIPVWPQHPRLPLPTSQSVPYDVGAVGLKPPGSLEFMSPASWACFVTHTVKGACLHALTGAVGNEEAQPHQQT